jgi:hypothetical protein
MFVCRLLEHMGRDETEHCLQSRFRSAQAAEPIDEIGVIT